MKPAPGITQHSVILCVSKRERGVGLQSLLIRAGYRVNIALSLYDALNLISQEMPHLVITEALLPDGSAGTLYDRLLSHPLLKKTPVLVHVLRKTKEELQPLAQRSFAGFFLGRIEPSGFLAKVSEIVQTFSAVSPHFVDADENNITTEVGIRISGEIIASSGPNLVGRSKTEFDPTVELHCRPQASGMEDCHFQMSANLRDGDEVYNLFPLRRVRGRGREWISGLPDSGSVARENRKVLFFHPDPKSGEDFKRVLEGYEIQATIVPSLKLCAQTMKQQPNQFQAIYLHWLEGDSDAASWLQMYGDARNQLPPIVVGTTGNDQKSKFGFHYLRRPFGLGSLLDLLEMCFEHVADLKHRINTNVSGVPVQYIADGMLIGLDEVGGIMEVGFPVLRGSRLELDHDFLRRAWGDNTTVQVANIVRVEGCSDRWQVRFEATAAGISKVKFWEKVSSQLNSAS